MKKWFLCFTFLIVSGFVCKSFCVAKPDSESQKFCFNTGIDTAYANEKRVYSVFDETGKENSRLEWEADYLFKLGITAGFRLGQFELFADALFPLPLECGKMYDSDWRTAGIKTNLSKSDLFIDFGCDASLGLKYNLELGSDNKSIIISPVIAISNSYLSLQAKNTIGWCGDTAHTHLDRDYSWDSEYEKKVKKYGIDLTNNITSVLFGVEASKGFGNIFVNAGILTSPYTYIICIDHHLNKEEGHYYQLIQKAYFKVWDFYAGAGYSINQNNAILFSTDFSFCPETAGDFYYGYYKIENIIADETSSFSFTKFSIHLSWQLSI